MAFAPGLRLDQRYVLIERIGLGGMSEVWRASDEILGRPVAVKALTPPIAPTLRAACRQEARAAARLAHPHVTQVYDYGEAQMANGEVVPYLVLELVDGQNLAGRLGQGPLPWPTALWVTAQVAAGLAAAHRIGVVHRDIKPGNVMLTRTGTKILDFGIAAIADDQPEADGGWLIGTPAYTAPERLRHAPIHPSADVYALGALFYEALTGVPPVPARSWQDAAAIHERDEPIDPPAVDGLPPAVADLCLACLHPDPAARPRAEAVADALHAALGVVIEPPDPVHDGPDDGPAPSSRPRPPLLPRSRPHADESPMALDDFESGAVVDGELPPRSMLAVVGVAGAMIAAGLVLALVATSFLATPGWLGTAGTGPTASRAAAPPAGTAGPGPGDSPPPAPESRLRTAVTRAIEQIDLLVTDALDDGEIRDDVAEDLRGILDDLRTSVAEGSTQDLRERIDDLRQEVGARRREGTIAADISVRIDLILASLIAARRDN